MYNLFLINSHHLLIQKYKYIYFKSWHTYKFSPHVHKLIDKGYSRVWTGMHVNKTKLLTQSHREES